MGWLRLKIQELVDYANAHASKWRPLEAKTATVERLRAEPADGAAFSLIGKWSAAGSGGESFGVVFEVGKFRFAIVANGKVSRSEGTWALNKDQLVLSGEGMNLTSSVSVRTQDQIVLKFNSQLPLTFTRQK